MDNTGLTATAHVNDYYTRVRIYRQSVLVEDYNVPHEDGNWRDGIKGIPYTVYHTG